MTGMTDKMAGPIALLRNARLVPVLTIAHVDHAVPLARALVAGGVRTLRSRCGPRPRRGGEGHP